MDSKYIEKLEEIIKKINPEDIQYAYIPSSYREELSFSFNGYKYILNKDLNITINIYDINNKKSIITLCPSSLYNELFNKYIIEINRQVSKNLEEWYNYG